MLFVRAGKDEPLFDEQTLQPPAAVIPDTPRCARRGSSGRVAGASASVAFT